MPGTCIISDCPRLARTLEMLGPALGANRSQPFECPRDDDPRFFSSTLRDMLRGTTYALVGFGQNDGERTLRTLLEASRSHQCGIVMTLEGYRGAIDALERQSSVDRSFLRHRVTAAVLVGDKQEYFRGLDEFFSKARITHIGGLHWAPTTCTKLAAFIRGDIETKVA